jgi:ribosomal protein L7Ae-like RNA K-turn-binding protein
MTGQRRCQACGKVYIDILRLAQHLKDKHNGRNKLIPDDDHVTTKQVSLADLLFASMGQQARQSKKPTEVKKGSPQHDKKKDTKPLPTTIREGGASSNGKQPRHKKNKKKTTKLKKGFLRSKALAAESYWQDVLSDIECSLASLREFVPPAVVVPNDRHQQQTGEAVTMSLHEMARQQLQHVQSKIKQLDASSLGTEAVAVAVSQSLKNDNSDNEHLVIIEDGPSSVVLPTSNIEDEVALLDLDDGNDEEDDDKKDDDVGSESSVDSTTTSSSDSSFCMQWGDTLRSWANSVGKEAGVGAGDSSKTKIKQQLPKKKQSTFFVKKPSINAAITIEKPFISEDSGKVEEKQQKQKESAPPPPPPFGSASGIPKPELYCEVCKVKMTGMQNFADHLVGRKHRANVLKMNKHNLDDQSSSSFLSTIPPLLPTTTPTTSKCYTGPGANVENYVNQVITSQLNTTVSDFVTKLLEWQERVRRNDPINLKRKRRLVSGLREAMKLVKLGKVKLLIVAPNVGSVVDADGKEECPVVGLLDGARRKEVPVVFALTRQKLGRLLGRQKYASVFAVLDCSGAEGIMNDIIEMGKKGQIDYQSSDRGV